MWHGTIAPKDSTHKNRMDFLQHFTNLKSTSLTYRNFLLYLFSEYKSNLKSEYKNKLFCVASLVLLKRVGHCLI